MKNQESSVVGMPSFFCMAAKTNEFIGKKERFGINFPTSLKVLHHLIFNFMDVQLMLIFSTIQKKSFNL
jgi:hypothetical protein